MFIHSVSMHFCIIHLESCQLISFDTCSALNTYFICNWRLKWIWAFFQPLRITRMSFRPSTIESSVDLINGKKNYSNKWVWFDLSIEIEIALNQHKQWREKKKRLKRVSIIKPIYHSILENARAIPFISHNYWHKLPISKLPHSTNVCVCSVLIIKFNLPLPTAFRALLSNFGGRSIVFIYTIFFSFAPHFPVQYSLILCNI